MKNDPLMMSTNPNRRTRGGQERNSMWDMLDDENCSSNSDDVDQHFLT